jgi:hypothetical protein
LKTMVRAACFWTVNGPLDLPNVKGYCFVWSARFMNSFRHYASNKIYFCSVSGNMECDICGCNVYYFVASSLQPVCKQLVIPFAA